MCVLDQFKKTDSCRRGPASRRYRTQFPSPVGSALREDIKIMTQKKTFLAKWPDKSTNYDMLDFKSYIKNLQGEYLVIERHMLQI